MVAWRDYLLRGVFDQDVPGGRPGVSIVLLVVDGTGLRGGEQLDVQQIHPGGGDGDLTSETVVVLSEQLHLQRRR
jgi:hypothetical protein